MDPVDLDALQCPDCRVGFAFTPARQPSGELPGEHGLLTCQCFTYPLLDGIPIITKGHVGMFPTNPFTGGKIDSAGLDVTDLTRLVSEGRATEALLRCLAYTPRLRVLDGLPGWRFWHRGMIPALGRRWIERRVTRLLRGDRRAHSAEDWFEHFFGSHAPSDASLLPYYRNRFALPRTLAALSILRMLPSSSKPVLDLACGLGPFGHYLTRRRYPAKVIGVDFNFYLVWGQKHFIAPRGMFVCADANNRLPFRDNAFSSVLCSDAFIYFREKAGLLLELNRCAPEEPIILTRVGNKTAFPSEAQALDAPGYMDLFRAGQPRVFSEYALVRHYLARSNPLASTPTAPADLRWDKWLTFLLNGHGLPRGTVDPSDEWPHEVGELTFNPLFHRRPLTDGNVACRFQFPTTWFAYQNADMYAYHGHGLECSSDIEQRGRSNPNDPDVRRAIEHFILIGLPDRYLCSQLRPSHSPPSS
jgi:SAM-dependent methyltransferase/uncharacterized protein YbaR (Trm112 family)